MRLHLLSILCIVVCNSYAQTPADTSMLPADRLSSFLNQTGSRIQKLDDQTYAATEKMLAKMQKQEERIAKKLKEKDSLVYQLLFANNKNYYQQLKEQSASVTDSARLSDMSDYIPYLDTLKTGLLFLGKNTDPLNIRDIKEAGNIVQQYEKRLQVSSTIKTAIQERATVLKEQLQHLGFVKELKEINKHVFYYNQQLEAYKKMLKDPNQLEAKTIEILSNTKLFRDFMQKNSMLAQLFRLPDNYGTPQALTGLQTRSGMQQLLQQRFSAASVSSNGGSQNPQQYMRQQMQAAQTQINLLKDKINKMGGGNSDMAMPDFKPNNQKTKSFFQRIEYGLNLQNERSSYLIPVTTDIAIAIGYKVNDKTVIGIGGSYKIGWGSGWNNIQLTSEGIGLRSYLDMQIKGSIWISGGWEYNYLQRFDDFSTIKNLEQWQRSGLIGITKKYKIGKKESKMQLLWDFMSYNQVPESQAIKFRIGYTF